MDIAGYYFVIGIWDIISLLCPLGLLFMFTDFKRRHRIRMERLELLYDNVKPDKDGEKVECSKLLGMPDELEEDKLENHMEKVLK